MHAAANFGGTISARDNDEQGYSEQRGSGFRKSYAENIENTSRAAKNMQFGENQSEEKSLANSLTGSYEKMEQLRDSISVHQQNIDRYQTNLDNTKSTSFMNDTDQYQPMVDYIASRKNEFGYPIGQIGAQKIIERGGEDFQDYYTGFLSKQISGSEVMRQTNYLNKNQDHNNHYDTKANNISVQHPIDQEQVLSHIADSKTKDLLPDKVKKDAKDTFIIKSFNNAGHNHQMKQVNLDQSKKIQEKVDFQEKEKRFAKGLFGITKEKEDTAN